MNIMNDNYRYEKEEFVQGLSGSSVGEIVVMTTVPSMLVMLCCLLKQRKREFGTSLGGMVLEYMILVVPEIGQVSGWDPRVVLGVVCSVTVVVFLSSRWNRRYSVVIGGEHAAANDDGHEVDSKSRELHLEMQRSMRDAVSVHRGNVMLLTCLSILAVDFRVFPRKYGKVETYGTSTWEQ